MIGQKDSSFELIEWHFDLVRLSLCEAPTDHAFLDTWRYLLIFYISDLMSQKFLVSVLAVFLQNRKVFAGWPECPEYLEIIWLVHKRSRWSRNCPDDLGSVQMIWQVSKWFEKCPDDLKSVQEVWKCPDDLKSVQMIFKVSRRSEKCLDDLKSVRMN